MQGCACFIRPLHCQRMSYPRVKSGEGRIRDGRDLSFMHGPHCLWVGRWTSSEAYKYEVACVRAELRWGWGEGRRRGALEARSSCRLIFQAVPTGSGCYARSLRSRIDAGPESCVPRTRKMIAVDQKERKKQTTQGRDGTRHNTLRRQWPVQALSFLSAC